MSLRPHPIPPGPEETARIARAACPRGHRSLTMWEEGGVLCADDDFATLFPTRGQPAEAPGRLAWIPLRQSVEDLADRHAAEAVRRRLDGQDALSLAHPHPGCDRTVRSEWRTRVVAGAAEQRRLDAVLQHCRERTWLTARGRQRPDAPPGLARVRVVNRWECVGATRRHALQRLAVGAPAWVLAHRPVCPRPPRWVRAVLAVET
jgi:transposase